MTIMYYEIEIRDRKIMIDTTYITSVNLSGESLNLNTSKPGKSESIFIVDDADKLTKIYEKLREIIIPSSTGENDVL